MVDLLKNLAKHFTRFRIAGRVVDGAIHDNHTYCGWAEDYLLGKSDADAWWYYERRQWQD